MRRSLALCALLAACGGSNSGNMNPGAVDAPPGTDSPAPIDSLTPPASTDPAGDGTHSVNESEVTIAGAEAGRTLPATIFVPDGAGPNALVVISPGFKMTRTQYASYARHFARWGYAVVLTDYADQGLFPNHTKLAADVPKVIDWAIARNDMHVDPDRIALAGHSLGGKVSIFAASTDARVKAIVAWDPVDSSNPSVTPEKMTTVTAAIAVVGETTNGTGGFMPCAPTADNFLQFFAASPSPALSVTVKNADHMDWVDDPTCDFCKLCDAGTAAPETVRAITRRIDVAWLRVHLDGDASMEQWLTAPSDGSATVQTK